MTVEIRIVGSADQQAQVRYHQIIRKRRLSQTDLASIGKCFHLRTGLQRHNLHAGFGPNQPPDFTQSGSARTNDETSRPAQIMEERQVKHGRSGGYSSSCAAPPI